MSTDFRLYFSIASIALTFIAFVPYLREIYAGKVIPHVFSWIIWALTTSIVFFAQLSDGAGVGAWPTGLSAAITYYIAFLAYRRSNSINITRSDSLFFISALAALPVWHLTQDALAAVVLLTLIDLLAFLPTLRKTYYNPKQENALFFGLYVIKSLFSIIALEHYSLTNILFPATIALTSTLLIGVLLWRSKRV
ncbi:MAG: hypothetical protein SVC26_08440 [Pseudomonadota bacterium]|nr:hypothetical protein [Pseudomonadota bacterium]